MAMSASGLGSHVSGMAGSVASKLSAGANYMARNGATSGVNSALTENDATGMVNSIFSNAWMNNAFNAAQADKAMQWQQNMWQNQANFNMQEAAKNRQWQEYMSNTAHQREVADLKAAGLNPVLSAMGGNGAAVGSGATASASGAGSGHAAQADNSLNSALVSVLGSMLSAQTTLESQRLTAENNLAVADKYTATSQLVAMLTGQYGLAQTEMAGKYGLQQAQTHANATLGAASMSSAASRYAADMQASIAKNYPNSWPAIVDRALGGASNNSVIKALNGMNDKAWSFITGIPDTLHNWFNAAAIRRGHAQKH